MLSRHNRTQRGNLHGGKLGTLILASALMLLPVSSFAGEDGLSDEFSMELDRAAVERVGEEEYQALLKFFKEAERAIESKDVKALMALYSDKYSNYNEDKKFAQGVWTQIFDHFDDISTKHSIELLTYDLKSGKPVAVLQCSGLLRGTPKLGAGQPVTIDSWDNQWHVLIDEGEWKLFGNSGKSKERYGAENLKTHPLF